VNALRNRLMDRFDDELEIIMTDERYGFIAGIMKEVQTTTTRTRVDLSRNIDLVLTNRYLGFPIFLFFIWAMFQTTFTLGAYPMDWIDAGVGGLSHLLATALPEGIVKGLLVDGILAGVGSVVIFLPNILILFFFIALFEDTGYMARAAFLMDRVMHLIGLHGKSFIPMLMGFGCNVPAIMATRTLESEKDRLLTILITPFMSCSAKLPVYIILAGTFFGARAGTVIFSIYLLGILVSILSGRLLRSTLFKGEDAPFVMELPPYRSPMLKSLLIHMWDRSKQFLRKMGGIILVGAMVVWVLSRFPSQEPRCRSPTSRTAMHWNGSIRASDGRSRWTGTPVAGKRAPCPAEKNDGGTPPGAGRTVPDGQHWALHRTRFRPAGIRLAGKCRPGDGIRCQGNCGQHAGHPLRLGQRRGGAARGAGAFRHVGRRRTGHDGLRPALCALPGHHRNHPQGNPFLEMAVCSAWSTAPPWPGPSPSLFTMEAGWPGWDEKRSAVEKEWPRPCRTD
jgi:spore maturation protein SpmB